MASTSSSTTTDSHPDNVTRYDVFLSFRGEDTRNSFTDHLYHALVRAGLHTFRDNDEIERGEEVNLAIVRAIEASEASIVVLSANYASSTWCLDELRLILEERRVRNHFVLPVFYHVDPSDVRKQSKDFTINVKSCGRWSVHNVNMWKAALTEVADLAGLTLSGPETIFLKTIVDTIYNKLDRKQVHLPHNLIGMGARVKEINSWLRDPDTSFLVICGMGGSGKTTLARYIVYSNWQNFDNISIIEDIGSRFREPHDLLQLQEKLFGDIIWGKKRKIPSVCQGTFKIEEALQKNKALIVLDDIVEQSQLFALLGSGTINKQSKIVITTRESSTFKWFEFRSWRSQEYKMELLDEDESLELLSLHAFGSKIVMEGYEEIAKKVLKYCEGNPLALEVLGSSLQEDNSIQSWKDALKMLEKHMHPGIHHVLVRSYNLLPYDIDRELFLHIACFFIGEDMDYVVKILEHDYLAMSRIKTLTKRCLLSISPNKKLLMHPLLQEMGRTIVHQESPKDPAKRSRVWCNKESYDLLRKGKGSKTMEGLALDMKTLREDKYALKAPSFRMDSFENMDKLKLLRLKYVQLTGSYEKFSEHLRWICWIGFHLRTIPCDLFLENLVALDMSYSSLEIFELPMVLKSLQFLNLQDSHNLRAIHNMFLLPNLETLILWNCHNLSYVCETIEGLKSLVLLNMTGCENLCKISGKITTFSLPHTLQQLFLKDCYIECTDSFPLGFSVQAFLQYLNLGNSLFEFLPDYNHLKSLRVLDLTLCYRLKQLLCLPSTLAELYVYYCLALEKITFQSCQFTLQEFGYEGCTSLCEIEGFIKLIPLAILDEADLGHMKWLKDYQNHEVRLVGDDELTIGRSFQLQMLYEFNIMSTSLPDIKDANLMPKYISESPSLSFDVPLCPKDKRLKGLNISFKYTTLAEENWAWFAKISTTNGVDLMYNPKLFGKPSVEEVGIWLSYWPIGNILKVGDKVNVSIVVVNGLEIRECGANLVYVDDEVANETMQNDMELVDILGGGLSRFQLTTGAYYMCRRDFFELMEAGKETNSWFRVLVGDTIDHTEVRGWRKTGRPQPSDQSFTELKTIRCIIHGPESDQFYNIAERAKPSFADETREFTSSIHETMKSDSLENRFQIGKNIQSHSEEDTKSPLVSHQQALAHVTAQAAFSQSYFNHVQVQPENGSSAPEVELQMVNAVNASSELEDSQIGSPDGFAGSQADVTEPQQLVYVSADANDGYNWRKYGQKQVKASEHPRSYYKCMYVNCPVKKKVGQSLDGHITDIVYKGQHNHEPPQHSKRAKEDADVSRPNGSQFERRLVEGSVADRGSNQFVRVDQGANNQLMRSDQGSNQLIRIDEPDDEPNPKRRNTEAGPVSVPVDPTSAQKMVSEPKIMVSTTSEVDLLDDGFKWRKYGQKVVKGNTNPRSYYKCTYAGCNVRKHVERAPSDPKYVVTTYEKKHNHERPVVLQMKKEITA